MRRQARGGAEARRPARARRDGGRRGVSGLRHPRARRREAPLQGVRVAAAALVALMLLTALMPWFVPADGLSLAGSAVTGFAGLFSGGRLPSVSFDGSYGLWQMPAVVGEGRKLAQYLGSGTLGACFMLYWIPFALYALALALGIVGIAKTFGRNGGKAALVCSALAMLLASVACLFIGTFFQSGYVETIWPSGLVAGMVLSLVALVVSAASRGRAKERALADGGSTSGADSEA